MAEWLLVENQLVNLNKTNLIRVSYDIENRSIEMIFIQDAGVGRFRAEFDIENMKDTEKSDVVVAIMLKALIKALRKKNRVVDFGAVVKVYGTLRKGMLLHSLIENCEFLGKTVLKGYMLYVAGEIPLAVETNNENDKLVVEVYDVPESVFRYIKKLEESAGYYTARVKTEYGEAFIWLSFGVGKMVIESGDYVEYIVSGGVDEDR